MKIKIGFANFCGRVFLALCLLVVVARPAFAYDDPPIRVARLNYVEGRVSFQPGGETDRAWATVNRPMTAGDSLWTGNGARAEMHIGSTAIRVGGQTLALKSRGPTSCELNPGIISRPAWLWAKSHMGIESKSGLPFYWPIGRCREGHAAQS